MIWIFSALALTLIIEVPIGLILIRQKSSLIPLILINVLTNPALNSLVLILFSLTENHTLYYTAVIIGELFVFIAEAFLLCRMCFLPFKRALLFSTVINTASLVIGSLILNI